MANQNIQAIALENLLVDLFNPRHVPQSSQRETIATIALEQGIKLVNLAEDIADKGLNPSEVPLVVETENKGVYTVVEGNRRIAALKLATSPQLLSSIGLPKNLAERFKALQSNINTSFPQQVNCAILSREDANHWILLKHTGENEGVGVVSWDGRARQRFRGSSPALQAIELVEESIYLDEETRQKLPKIAITNVERILGTPDARKLLGVDVKNGQLILTGSNDEAIVRLASMVSDVANRRVKVTDLDTKEQRVDYAQKIANQPLPQPGDPISLPAGANGASPGKAKPAEKKKPGRNLNPDRRTLIPRQFKVAIQHTRINRIYHELRILNVDEFANSCAVMFRVFIELSIDHFAQTNKISLQITPKPSGGAKANPPSGALKPREMYLREKISAAIEHLESQKVCSADDLRGIKSLVANRNHVLSVDSLNGYVHNKDYSPAPSDLKANWDSIQIFVERLWA